MSFFRGFDHRGDGHRAKRRQERKSRKFNLLDHIIKEHGGRVTIKLKLGVPLPVARPLDRMTSRGQGKTVYWLSDQLPTEDEQEVIQLVFGLAAAVQLQSLPRPWPFHLPRLLDRLGDGETAVVPLRRGNPYCFLRAVAYAICGHGYQCHFLVYQNQRPAVLYLLDGRLPDLLTLWKDPDIEQPREGLFYRPLKLSYLLSDLTEELLRTDG